MIRGIDHLVIAVPDPDAAAEQLESHLGVACTAGGEHQGIGTFNRIAWLADGAYLELMGVSDAEAAAGHPIAAAAHGQLAAHGAGLAAYALVVDDLERLVAELRSNDSSISPSITGSRQLPGGEAATWRLAVPPRLGSDGLPFLIEHLPSGPEWSPQAVRERTTQAHPLGSPVRLAGIDLADADPLGHAADYQATLGIEFWAVADLAVVELGRHIIRLRPIREMSHPAVVTLEAAVDTPLTAELFGLRIDVQPVPLSVAVAR